MQDSVIVYHSEAERAIDQAMTQWVSQHPHLYLVIVSIILIFFLSMFFSVFFTTIGVFVKRWWNKN